MGFQNPAGPLMEQNLTFHDLIITVTVSIAFATLSSIIMVVHKLYTHRMNMNSQFIETVWTLLPSIVLICIITPSLRLLYVADGLGVAGLTVKALGHQWY